MAKSILSLLRSSWKRALCCGLSLLYIPTTLVFACLGAVLGFVIGMALGGVLSVSIACAILGAILGASLVHCCCMSLRSCDAKDDGSDSNDDEARVEVSFDLSKCLCGDDEEDEQSCWDPSDPCTCNWQALFGNLIRRLFNITCSFAFNLCCCCNQDDDGSSTTSSSSSRIHRKDSTHEDISDPTVLNQPEVQLCERPDVIHSPLIKISDLLPVEQPEDSKDSKHEENDEISSSNWLYEVFLGSLFYLWNDIMNLEFFTNRGSSDEESDLEAGTEGPGR